MNAAAGIEPDNDRVTPVGRQCELNPVDDALPSPASPNHADRFTDVQLAGFHGTGCLREGVKSYVKPVTGRRRCRSTRVQVARTFWPCSRKWPWGPTYLGSSQGL